MTSAPGHSDWDGVPYPGVWAEQGLCRGAMAVFFPERGEDSRVAQKVCSRCPVIVECAEYALPIPGLRGVWGGLSERERKRLRREQRKAS